MGLTGTNGKTTLSYLIEAVLTAADPARPVGVMGTVEAAGRACAGPRP